MESKELKEFAGMYVIYKDGKVYSKHTNKFMKPKINQKGYIYFGLRKDGKQKSVFQHRLIAQSWIENKHNKEQINHINSNKKDNRLENLEWCTNGENQIHSYLNGKRAAYKDKFGKDHNQSKPVFIVKDVSIIDFENITRASEYLKCSIQAVSMAVRGINQTCKGYKCYYL